MKKKKNITCVADYLDRVKQIVDMYPDEIIVYRGEDKLYDEPCKPNIFRKSVLNKSAFYEKNLLDAMRQHRLSDSNSYLENAIDAQHGEFPSRLLDVSYNCLVALYFAVTPYYHQTEDYHDNDAGEVFIFHFTQVASPSAKVTQECYDDIINKKQSIIANNMLFNKNHFFIDHCKMNHRIVAQQGAFILFQGDDAEPIPAYLFEGIKIPPNSKKTIRNELKVLFGIHTGTIYPEIVNLAADLTQKSEKITCSQYSYEVELRTIGRQFEKELNYYYNKIISTSDDKRTDVERIAEKVIYSYYIGILQLRDYIKNLNLEKPSENILVSVFKTFVDEYNLCLEGFQEGLLDINNSSIDIKNLKINTGEDNEYDE